MLKYCRLSGAEREFIMVSLVLGKTYRVIAGEINRNISTISRETAFYRIDNDVYSAKIAHEDALYFRTRKRWGTKIDCKKELVNFIHEKLRLKWSPMQISKTLKKQFPADPAMNVSHETIYTYLYMLPKGELRKELISHLRQEKKLRQNRKGVTEKRGTIPNMISIHERPAEVADRIIPGHWEGDLIMGKDHASAMGTIVERTTRTVILVPLKAKDALSVRKAFAKELKTLPEQMRLSMTYDRGKEMSQHQLFTKETKMQVYFCDPHSPWQRGTNENTNMLIRGFFKKGTDFNTLTRKNIKDVQHMLNERPRATLNWDTPKEKFTELLVALEA